MLHLDTLHIRGLDGLLARTLYQFSALMHRLGGVRLARLAALYGTAAICKGKRFVYSASKRLCKWR